MHKSVVMGKVGIAEGHTEVAPSGVVDDIAEVGHLPRVAQHHLVRVYRKLFPGLSLDGGIERLVNIDY